jgi:hypothetical protein
MPNDEKNHRDHPPNGGRRVLRNFILLTLPWLSFQRDTLAIMKKGIEDASHVRPIQNLMFREIQALMMIFDPSGRWRNFIDRDLQEQIKETHTKAFPKFLSSIVYSIEAQEAVLASISELFDKIRKENKTSGGTRTKSTKETER